MLKKLLTAGCSALVLTLCTPAMAETAAPPAPPADPAPMVWPAMGFDPADVDPSVDSGNDFDAYVNGKWKSVTTIPPQYVSYGVVRDLSLASERHIREIIFEMAKTDAPKGSIEQKVGDAYAAFVDVDTINAKGLAPLQPYLDRIFAVKNEEDLAKLFGTPGIPDPFVMDVHSDAIDPNKNILNMWIGGYGLPDRDNYLVDNDMNIEMRAKYKAYLTFLLGKAGYADPAVAAESVYQLEHALAAMAFDRTLSRNPRLLYNVVPRSDLVVMAGDFPLQTMLDGLNIGETETLVVDEMRPDAAKAKELGFDASDMAKLGGGMPAVLAYVSKVPIETWQAWAAAHLIDGYSAFLPSDIDEASFAFWGTYMSGQKEQRPRDKRGVSLVNGTFGEAVGKLYVERQFSPEAKAKMIELVGNLQKAMESDIHRLGWMSEATKEQALDKLSKFTVKIGYPDKFETYEGLDVSADDALGNAVNAGKWAWADQVKDLGKPVDRAKWHMTPQTVNAYYNSSMNEIVFPAAYLQPPNFSLSADPAVNYAIIGSTIGHEISHGFDDKGSMYDGDGQLRNWWTPDDRAKFDAAAKNLVAQYDAFCPLDDGKTCINGELTLGENIADLAGVTIAYQAYKMSLNGKEAPVIDGLTGDQRFFIAYAIGNRGMWTDELTRQILQTDPHSPDKARTNVVLANFDPWYKAFDVKPGDAMYLPPEKRVKMW